MNQNDPKDKPIPPTFDEDEELWLLNESDDEKNFRENVDKWGDWRDDMLADSMEDDDDYWDEEFEM